LAQFIGAALDAFLIAAAGNALLDAASTLLLL
jgi:hypothetical protein